MCDRSTGFVVRRDNDSRGKKRLKVKSRIVSKPFVILIRDKGLETQGVLLSLLEKNGYTKKQTNP